MPLPKNGPAGWREASARTKEHYHLKRIRARTKKTEVLWIFFGIHTGNALEIGRHVGHGTGKSGISATTSESPMEEVCPDIKKTVEKSGTQMVPVRKHKKSREYQLPGI
ncbi:MAG: hypothetical protein R2814_11140 [Flavobacteriaceae bacterium]